jgi:phosphoenolpyruvate synthase/pyruvate phosphate dikinase
MSAPRFIRWFKEIGIGDVGLVGGKNASLGEMYRELRSKGIRIPNGFAVTAEGYRHFLKASSLEEKIAATLRGLDTRDLGGLAERGRKVREAILAAPLPPDLRQEIVAAYGKLCQEYGPETDTAVRTSATAEDLPEASFAGAGESYLNVRGQRALLEACRQCIASLFTDRGISYRVDKGYDNMAVALSIGVQKMVRSDLGASGVLFTLDTESGFPDVVLINGTYGLGEMVVKGRVDPDEFLVFKPTLKQGHRAILKRSVGAKQEKLVYAVGGSQSTRIVKVAMEDRRRLCLADDDVLTLARWGCLIEDHYSARAKHPVPMDVEWAKDGKTGELFIVQARPETVHALAGKKTSLEVYELAEAGKVLLEGRSVGEKIGAGAARVIKNLDQLQGFRPGEVLVADMTDPDWEPAMKMATAIVTNPGAIQVHPLALLRFASLPEGPVKEKIAQLTHGFEDKGDYFVQRLAEGVGRIAAAFYPKDVIVRLSDFKSNEYAGLLGGQAFEPKEENPMLGFRGASRYYDERYRDAFLLECRAMKQVREDMGLTNVKLMVPVVRTVEEGKKVLAVMREAGLERGKNGLEVYMMCEIPANVILAEEFAEVFDGFSIGSNDLTQLTLGLDRDSQIVAHLFDERNPAVMRLVEDVIRRARACGRKIGICGQAPSDYPEFARFLVKCGIDSISLNPDTVLKTTREIVNMEKEIGEHDADGAGRGSQPFGNEPVGGGRRTKR